MTNSDVRNDPRPLRRLWLSWGVLSVIAIAIAAGIFLNERKNRLREAEQRLQVEIGYLAHITGAALRNGEFEQARDQMNAWGRLNADTVRLQLTADNGFVLGEFHREFTGLRIQGHSGEIPFSYRGKAVLLLEKSIEAEHAAIATLGWQLLGGLVVLELLAFSLFYQSARYQQQVRLTQDEFQRRQEAQAALERMATLDALTGLPNRYLLDEQLWLRVAEARRFKRKLAVLFIDLDNFKHINDSFGHDAGDQLLKAVAGRMAGCLRGYDMLSRFGGDEFVVVISNVSSVEEVDNVAHKLTQALQPRIEVAGRELFVSSSVGVSLFPDDGDSPGDLLRKADAAMYTAKEAGKDCFRFYTSSMNEALQRRQAIEQGLHDAITNGDLYLVYQPQVDIRRGRPCSCEALLRWRAGDREIGPGDFIPIAEQSALMKQVQTFVVGEALRQCAAWKRLGLTDLRVDINLSGGRLVIEDMFPLLDEALQANGLTPRDVGIELTEHTLIEASEETIDRLVRLRGLGCTVSLDDFGTGYSSLGYLKRLPVDILKIDRTFIKDLPDGPMDCAIVKAVIAMGQSMGKKILAEGIETQAQLEYVRENGCDMAQGHLLYPPMPAAELDPILGGW